MGYVNKQTGIEETMAILKILIVVLILLIQARCNDGVEEKTEKDCPCIKPSGNLCEENDFQCDRRTIWCGKDYPCAEGDRCVEWKIGSKWYTRKLKPDLRCVMNDPECEVIEVCRWMRINVDEEQEICKSLMVCNKAEYTEGYACNFDYQCASRNCNEKLRVCEAKAVKLQLEEVCEVDFQCEEPLICIEGKCTEGIAAGERCDPEKEYNECERYTSCMCTKSVGDKCEAEDYRCRPQRCTTTEQCMFEDVCVPFQTGNWFTLRPGECMSGLPGCEIIEEKIEDEKNSEGFYLPSKRITVRCNRMELNSGYSCANALFSFMGGINCESGVCLLNGTCK